MGGDLGDALSAVGENWGEESGGLVIVREPVYWGGDAESTHKGSRSGWHLLGPKVMGHEETAYLTPRRSSRRSVMATILDLADRRDLRREGKMLPIVTKNWVIMMGVSPNGLVDLPVKVGVNLIDTGLVADYEWDRDDRKN
jgi:hypothetical protein